MRLPHLDENLVPMQDATILWISASLETSIGSYKDNNLLYCSFSIVFKNNDDNGGKFITLPMNL